MIKTLLALLVQSFSNKLMMSKTRYSIFKYFALKSITPFAIFMVNTLLLESFLFYMHHLDLMP